MAHSKTSRKIKAKYAGPTKTKYQGGGKVSCSARWDKTTNYSAWRNCVRDTTGRDPGPKRGVAARVAGREKSKVQYGKSAIAVGRGKKRYSPTTPKTKRLSTYR